MMALNPLPEILDPPLHKSWIAVKVLSKFLFVLQERMFNKHKLPIEKGRYIGIARDDRICNLCNSAFGGLISLCI